VGKKINSAQRAQRLAAQIAEQREERLRQEVKNTTELWMHANSTK